MLSQSRSRTSELVLGDRLRSCLSRSVTFISLYDTLLLIDFTDRHAFVHIGTGVFYRKARVLKLSFDPLSILRGAAAVPYPVDTFYATTSHLIR